MPLFFPPTDIHEEGEANNPSGGGEKYRMA